MNLSLAVPLSTNILDNIKCYPKTGDTLPGRRHVLPCLALSCLVLSCLAWVRMCAFSSYIEMGSDGGVA